MCSQSNQQYACSSSNSCVGVHLQGSCLRTHAHEEEQLQLAYYNNWTLFHEYILLLEAMHVWLCMLLNGTCVCVHDASPLCLYQSVWLLSYSKGGMRHFGVTARILKHGQRT